MSNYKNPVPTVDIIIEMGDKGEEGIVLIERKNPPIGWAIPGGFVDYGETVEAAAIREAKEETGLDVTLKDLLYVYSDPKRDPRQHTVSIVFIASGKGRLQAADDAINAAIFPLNQLPSPLCFDHELILRDYLGYRRGIRPSPRL
ncbi:MAG: NUDIX hydrolase [Geminocystis sp.]|nr:NUDIX hydrolase [Geminocystis sp.]MCX8077687.1 NUDIX hydrolase [Geminocystis sp.]MDW8116579.1 NUDIX hydrolase [Geminocystis sp.]HIK37317.1 NUDIX hydrolase [Geminocystis sp. M7585_C2015_104]